MAKRILDAEITHIDENDDAIMLPLDLLPDDLISGQQVTVTIVTP